MRKRQVAFVSAIPGRIQRLAEGLPGGEHVLEYLRSPEAIALMEAAIEAGRPPVVAISAELVKRNRQLLNLRPGRRFIGEAVRLILKAKGYEPERSGVYISGDPAFTVGTTYRAIDEVETTENKLLKHILDGLSEREVRWAYDYLARRLARR